MPLRPALSRRTRHAGFHASRFRAQLGQQLGQLQHNNADGRHGGHAPGSANIASAGAGSRGCSRDADFFREP